MFHSTVLRILLTFLFCLGPARADEVGDTCQRIARKLASINLDECLARQLSFSGALSEQNIPLLIKEYPPAPERSPQARILLLGGMHGDEYSSVSIVFKWLAILDQHHSGLFHWQVAPLVNPDGMLRKKSQRTNANGVDLNRNFQNGDNPDDAMQYWQRVTNSDPRRYPGQQAMSEAETRWVTQLINEFKPDAIVSVHAPYNLIDFDGPPDPPTHLGPLHLHLLGTYPGSLGQYAGKHLNIPVITVELPYAGIMPSNAEVLRIWTDLVGWLRNNIPKTNVVESKSDIAG
jgi:hypothetical protein